MLKLIKFALEAIARMFGYSKHRSELRNTPEMKANKEAKIDENQRTEAINAVVESDIEEVRRRASGGTMKILLACLLALAGPGCASTVAPKAVPSRSIDFDGSYQDAGILGKTADGSLYLVTQFVIDRYNQLIGRYGKRFTPAANPNKGVTEASISPTRGRTYYMDLAAMARYLWMIDESRSGS